MNTGVVRLYTFIVEIGGSRFGGHIPARSFEEVKTLVPTATEIGELIEQQFVGQMCSGCAGPLVIKAVDDDWPGEII